MSGCDIGRDRKILPIRENVDGDEIDGSGELAVAQPEFPDIRIGHRHPGRGFDLPQDRGNVLDAKLTAQQHLVADHDPVDGVRITPGERDRGVDLDAVLLAVTAKPKALEHFNAQALRYREHLVEPVVGCVGAHATGQAGKL